MDFIPILRISKPLTEITNLDHYDYGRYWLGPSSVLNRFRVFTQDKSQVISLLPNGEFILNDPAEHDGGYEAVVVDGSRLAYDYDELEVNPVVFEVIIMVDVQSGN